MDSRLLEVLDHCTEVMGLEYDPVLGKQLLHQAEREFPGSGEQTWLQRLALIGESFGLRVAYVRLTVRAAIDQARLNMPIIGYAPQAPSEVGAWIILERRRRGRGRLGLLGDDHPHREVSQRELSEWLGQSDPKSLMEWAVLHPIAPLEAMRDPNASGGHQARHGHAELQTHHASALQGEGEHEAPSPLRRFFGLLRPETREIHVVVLYTIGVAVLSLALPLTVEALVTTVALNLLVQQLMILTLILFLCLILAAVLQGLKIYLVEIIQQRLFARLSADLGYRLPRVRADAYDDRYGPELVNRFFEVPTVQKSVAQLVLDGIGMVLSALIGLMVLAFYHPFLLGYDLMLIAAVSFTLFVLGRGAIRTSIEESRAKYAVGARLEEFAYAPIAYKLEEGQDFAIDLIDSHTRRYLLARKRHFQILFRQIKFTLALQVAAVTTLLGLGGYLVILQQITLGQLVAAEVIVVAVVGSFTQFGKHLEAYYDVMASMDKLGLLMDLPLERHHGDMLEPGDSPSGAEIWFEDVTFGYHEHHPVIHDLSLHLKPGDRVAMVGPSGSGKSTLVDLLYGLRQPWSGTILIDGQNYRDIRPDSLRSAVAVVKGLEILEETVIENVRVGRSWISLRDVRLALEEVGLLGEVVALPDGLHTRLSTPGSPLSYGQKRRLMIARAIVGQPRFLVIDEGIDGLDIDSRSVVLEMLTERDRPWTLLMVTHRQDVADHCDRVIGMARGHAEHNLVMSSNGHSRNLEDWLKELRRCRLN